MRINQSPTQRRGQALLAGTLALLLMLGLSLLLSRFRVLAQSAVEAETDFTVTKEVNKTEDAAPGETLVYTITINNNTSDPVNAWMTDTLPPELTNVSGLNAALGSFGFANGVITWSYNLNAHQWDQITFSAEITSSIATYTEIENTAQVTGTGELITSSVTTKVTGGVLQAIKSVYPTEARPGQHLTYTVRITNVGNAPVTTAWMTDDLPGEVSFVSDSLTATLGSFGAAGGVITWTNVSGPAGTPLLPEQEAIITYTVAIEEDLIGNPHITNTAQITGAGVLTQVQAIAQAITNFQVYFPIMRHNYPPVPRLDPIPPPVNRSYTVSWQSIEVDFDRYVLQQSRRPDFSTIVAHDWPNPSNATLQLVQGAYCAFYYRVRVDNAAVWGEGSWSNVEAGHSSPPSIVLQEIPAPGTNNSYTIQWSLESIPPEPIDRYRLQEATDANFTNVTREWQPTGTSQLVQQGPAGGTLYYRVRAEDDDCWDAQDALWSNVKSVLVAYRYDFNSPTKLMNPWPIRRTTYWQGDRAGVTWTEEHDGTLFIVMSDKWDFALASPMVAAPPPPYAIQSRVKIRDPSNLVSYGLFFGGNGGSPCPAYRETGCLTHYYRLNVVWYNGLRANLKRIDYHESEKGKGRGVDLSDWKELAGEPYYVDPNGWNTWEIQVNSDGLKVFINGQLFASTSDTSFVHEPYFGVFTSTDEYKPSIGEYDYYNVIPR